jgi:hypothetical protein
MFLPNHVSSDLLGLSVGREDAHLPLARVGRFAASSMNRIMLSMGSPFGFCKSCRADT